MTRIPRDDREYIYTPQRPFLMRALPVTTYELMAPWANDIYMNELYYFEKFNLPN